MANISLSLKVTFDREYLQYILPLITKFEKELHESPYCPTTEIEMTTYWGKDY